MKVSKLIALPYNLKSKLITLLKNIEIMTNIENGDVYDIGQTVNGVSRFLFFNNTWYYFEERFSMEYEYNQNEMTQTVLNYNETEDITFIKNIFY